MPELTIPSFPKQAHLSHSLVALKEKETSQMEFQLQERIVHNTHLRHLRGALESHRKTMANLEMSGKQIWAPIGTNLTM